MRSINFSKAKRQIVHLCLLLFSFISFAQGTKQDLTQYYINNSKPCGGMDAILIRKGSWQKDNDAIVFPDNTFPPSQFSQLNSRIDKILPLFKEALPDLSGFEPKWYRVIDGKSYITNGAMPYEFSSLYLTYFCNANTKKIELGSETGTWAYVYVNHLGWFWNKVGEWDINGDGKMITVYSLPAKVGKWKETTLYAPSVHDFDRAIVIGHNGEFPWHSLSQKQYLTGLKNKWQNELQKQMDTYDETEGKMKKNLGNVSKNIQPDLAEKIKKQQEDQLKDYQTKKEKYKSSSRKFYDEEIRYIDEYLASASAETLEQPAIIDPKFGALKFRGTFGDETKGGSRLGDISSKYFNKDLPRYVPQFVVLYWRWTEEPVSLNFRKQFEENFPVEKLKALIDK